MKCVWRFIVCLSGIYLNVSVEYVTRDMEQNAPIIYRINYTKVDRINRHYVGTQSHTFVSRTIVTAMYARVFAHLMNRWNAIRCFIVHENSYDKLIGMKSERM